MSSLREMASWRSLRLRRGFEEVVWEFRFSFWWGWERGCEVGFLVVGGIGEMRLNKGSLSSNN